MIEKVQQEVLVAHKAQLIASLNDDQLNAYYEAMLKAAVAIASQGKPDDFFMALAQQVGSEIYVRHEAEKAADKNFKPGDRVKLVFQEGDWAEFKGATGKVISFACENGEDPKGCPVKVKLDKPVQRENESWKTWTVQFRAVQVVKL